MQTIRRPDLFLAGQLTGVEGYVESIGSGLVAGLNLSRILAGQDATVPPPETMLGGLAKYLTTPNRSFAPMNANFGLLAYRRDRSQMVKNSLEMLEKWMPESRI
jgi:methylenetetrahydrofolate--tRNA-(uracil-5-)-methyltransferase